MSTLGIVHRSKVSITQSMAIFSLKQTTHPRHQSADQSGGLKGKLTIKKL